MDVTFEMLYDCLQYSHHQLIDKINANKKDAIIFYGVARQY